MLSNTWNSAVRSVVMVIAVASLLALCSESALAQCVMCRASLGSNSTFIRNFNIGVLVLLVPPVAIFCTIFVLAFRHRRSG
jgi:heme/copper-type cytochrome/quinol oxidase subunit 2